MWTCYAMMRQTQLCSLGDRSLIYFSSDTLLLFIWIHVSDLYHFPSAEELPLTFLAGETCW